MNTIKNLPEFSHRNYEIAGYVVGATVTCSGAYLIYQILFNSDITFTANWNMFKSVLMWPLYIIGLLVMFANWNMFNFSYDTYDKITYDDGHVEVKRNWDIMEWMLGHVVFPLLCRFFLVPIIIAALIYYPLMCIVHLIGSIFPYILSLIIVGIIFMAWMFTRWFQFRYHSIVLILVGIVFTGVFSVSGFIISEPKFDGNIQLIVDNQQPKNPGNDGPGTPNDPGNNGPKPGNSNDPGNDGTPNVSGNNGPDNNTPPNEKPDDDKGKDGGDDNGKPNGKPNANSVKTGGGPCVGLYTKLPSGTTEFEGMIAGFPIEFAITKDSKTGALKATFINIDVDKSIELEGEEIDCDISFFGKADGIDWIFYLSGTLDDIIGTVKSGDGKRLKVNLHQKRNK